MTQADVFSKKLKEFDKLIRYASWRLKRDGVIEAQDLYQEGLLLLNKMFSTRFDPDSVDFRKMFKTELWHGLKHIVHDRKATKRGLQFRNGMVNVDDLNVHLMEKRPMADSLKRDVSVYTEEMTSHENGELSYLETETQKQIDYFLEELTHRLDDEARIVLLELLQPREWSDIPEDQRVTKEGDEHFRLPSKVPQATIARYLGMSSTGLRRAVKRIREAAVQLHEDLDLRIVSLQPVSH